MAVLLIDVGNTRIKWARFEGGPLRASQAAVHAGWHSADYGRRLLRGARGLQRVLVSSVAGPAIHRTLSEAARRAAVPITFLKVPARGGGITVGYSEPWRLGVDRFAGLVGAHELLAGVPVLVAGVGTALTLDLLNGEGRHFGGAITPGPALMVETLLARTYGIRRRAQGGTPKAAGLFGRSTRAAIAAGARYAAAAAIDRAAEEAEPRVGRRPLVVLTGGGATPLRPLLHSCAVGVPDLVLLGLAVLAGQPARR